MSFVNQDNIISLVEALLHSVWPSEKGTLQIPFPRMTYREALEEYGSDKPDTRFNMKLQDLTNIFRERNVDIFTSHLSNNDGVVKAFVIKTGSEFITRQILLDLKYFVWERYHLQDLFHIKIINDFSWTGSIVKDIPKTIQEVVGHHLQLSSGDSVIIAAGSRNRVCAALGKLRLKIADLLHEKGVPCRETGKYNFLWVVDFPLFLKSEDGHVESAHHPFTAPHDDDIEKLFADPLKVRSKHYDLVLNGNEIGGGSIRIHDFQMQQYVLNSILQEDAKELFYLIEALDCGCPPHGGIALGLDRLLAILCDVPSIRDVIAFPKSADGKDLMSDAPAPIKSEDYVHYHISPRETSSAKVDSSINDQLSITKPLKIS